MPHRLVVDRDMVDLIDIDLLTTPSAGEVSLSPEEWARAGRFTDPPRRARFVNGRAMLRRVLGAVLGIPARDVRLERGAHGKPRLATAHGVDVRFNLSHSAERAALAVTLAREVGVDVERLRRDVEALEIARRFFAPGESAAIEALPAAERTEAFFRFWTCKESYLKARGEGLLSRLDAFEVAPAGYSTRILWSTLDGLDVVRWRLMQFDPGAGYVGAVAIEGSLPTLRRWSASPSTGVRRGLVT